MNNVKFVINHCQNILWDNSPPLLILEKGYKILDEQSSVSFVDGNSERYLTPRDTLNLSIYNMPELSVTNVIDRIENGIKLYTNSYWVLYRKVVIQ